MPQNPDHKRDFNKALCKGVGPIVSFLNKNVEDVKFLVLDAMDPKGLYPNTTRHLMTTTVLGKKIQGKNIYIVTSSTQEAKKMCIARRKQKMWGVKVIVLSLPDQADLLAGELFDVVIMDGCSGRPRTIGMMRAIKPYLGRNAVIVLGMTRNHNQDALKKPPAKKSASVQEREDIVHSHREKSIKCIQDRTIEDMAGLGAVPFGPMSESMDALSLQRTAPLHTMVYTVFVIGPIAMDLRPFRKRREPERLTWGPDGLQKAKVIPKCWARPSSDSAGLTGPKRCREPERLDPSRKRRQPERLTWGPDGLPKAKVIEKCRAGSRPGDSTGPQKWRQPERLETMEPNVRRPIRKRREPERLEPTMGPAGHWGRCLPPKKKPKASYYYEKV